MKPARDYFDRIADDGFAIVENVLSPSQVEQLRHAMGSIPAGAPVRRKANIYGVRNLLEISSETRDLAASTEVRSLVCPILGPGCFAVRATFFDKVRDTNWNVGWHQDAVISVRERLETPDFEAWSNKIGTWQVRPPDEVMLHMLAIRIHLDDCPASNGALRVLAGSHSKRWPREQLADCKQAYREVVCEIGLGGVLAMRPLLLHASSASTSPSHRRVIHIEFACYDLPGDLEWKQRVASPV